MVFKTERLYTRPLQLSDELEFFDMMGNPNVMSPVPQAVKTREESDQNLKELIENPKEKVLWAICEHGSEEFIGLCALLKNDENQHEIGYRLRESFWRVGYGTEITKGLIAYSFDVLKFDLITADVNITNIPSVKILDKFFSPVREFYNPSDDCTDRRYSLVNPQKK